MLFAGRWAIFWILVTCAVADSVKNGNENNPIGVKASRLVFTSIRQEKRIRTRRDNVTDTTKRRIGNENVLNSKNLIDDIVRQTQHPIKKQIKFKRLRFLSNDQNNSKIPTVKLKEDVKEYDLRPTNGDSIHSSTLKVGGIRVKISENVSKQIGMTSEEDAITLRPEVVRRTPSHRKKHRRLSAASSSIRPQERSVPREYTVPLLDFGKKISTRTNINSVDGFGQMAYAFEPQTSTKLNEKLNERANAEAAFQFEMDRQHQPTQTYDANSSSLCTADYATIKTANIGNLKRKINLNATSPCDSNAPDKLQSQKRTSQEILKMKTATNDVSAVETTISHKISSIWAATEKASITTPPIMQFSTKFLTSTVTTLVSTKTDDQKSKTVVTGSTPTILHFDLPDYPNKPEMDTRIFKTYNLSEVVLSATRVTMRPGFLPSMRANLSKTYRNLNNNMQQLSKHSPPSFDKIFTNFATITSESPNTLTSNSSEPGFQYQYLMNSTSTKTRMEITAAPATTLRANYTTRLTGKYTPEQEQTSFTSLFVTYEGLNKNRENWVYRVRNDTIGSTAAVFTSTDRQSNFEQPHLTVISGPQRKIEEITGEDQSRFHVLTYFLASLGVIPLLVGIVIVSKMIFGQNKKQIFEGSEYSSEYNRNPLEFNAGVTSSPIVTKLQRVTQQVHLETEKKPSLPISAINLPNNSQWEFPRSKLRLQTILGQGNFGQVWKAEADDINGHEGSTRLVAVKMVKEISSSREKEDLIKELIIMQHLGSHPNVVTLLGCCTEIEPYMLILEYVMYGKLLSFLRDHRTRTYYFNFSEKGDALTSRDLTIFAYCVARGMEYLQHKQIIHRDLAARNILIDHNKLCKIADFGMSRRVEESGQIYEHRQSKGALPIRWMAPESLQYSCYTHKTDVWSFGILMWEIVTLGSMPYATMGARVVMRKVKEGYRLEKPKYCKQQIFNVINNCWDSEPDKRPSFSELKQELYNLLEDTEYRGNYVDLEGLANEMNQIVRGSHNENFKI